RAPATHPTTQPAPTTNPADRAPSSFWFKYGFDKASPRRDWTRINAKTWEEDDGNQVIRFELVDVKTDPKDPGVILTRLPSRDMEVFIPTLDNTDKRLGWRY